MDSYNENVKEENDDIASPPLIWKCIVKTLFYPLDYARFLVQIGHEPMEPYPSIFEENQLYLPNLIVYAKYIYSVNGFKGMYVGLAPKIVGVCIEHLSTMFMADYIQIDKNQNIASNDSDLELWKKCAITTSKEIICTATTIILSHPLHIVSMRMMAQFVGYEHRYTSVLQSMLLINREEGVNGLFSGVIPRLCAGLGTVILINVAKQVFSRYIFDSSPMILNITDFAASFLANVATYSFNVVTACTAINNCGLAAGMPPDMPVFGNWWECMRYLYRCDQLNRGSSTWFRCAPQTQSKLLKCL